MNMNKSTYSLQVHAHEHVIHAAERELDQHQECVDGVSM